ncbi:response regulator transcription factor [Actinomyces gerencseriae]|uniref:response regulator transcription factor n=1 Tax=Actinomyces gerencseriae TaxID=52769 RepID=UPI0023F220BD|nr:response regulator transcription factor [Actinomyces gerencseriae]
MTHQNPASTIRVIVVDDDAIVRETLSSILDSEPDIDVIATAADGAEAVGLVHERTVDVALMDIQMPVLNGVEATSRILETSERTRVLLLTTFDDDTFLDGGIAAGASGFLLKTTRPAEIAGVIRTIHAGGKVLSPEPTSRILDRYLHGRSPNAGTITDLDLSDREQQVLRLLCQARTNHQIARQMNVAETTVKTHVSSIMRKMGVGSRLEIVVEAHKRGIGG